MELTALIRDIRKHLRLAMNGIVSTSMRNQGILYKLNFGVSLPTVKQMAQRYEASAPLAEALWKEDVRELKLLATMLYPLELFTEEVALRWVHEVRHQEIAEQLTANLLSKASYAEGLAATLLSSEDEFSRVMGFLIHAYCSMQLDYNLLPNSETQLLSEARIEMDKGLSRTTMAALLALKRYGRTSKEKADQILVYFNDYLASEAPTKAEFYEDLRFEYSYYHE